MTPEQIEAVNDSDAVCEGCGANPREAESLEGWFIDTILVEGDPLAQIRCPQCW